MLAPMAVGDVFESRGLDATPASNFSCRPTVTFGLRGPSVDVGLRLWASGASSITQTPPVVTRPLFAMPNGEVIEAGYTGPTMWTDPSIDYMLQNSPLI